MSDPPPRVVVRLTGVYHAEGTLLGEVRYLVGSRLGRTHCGLCDITHGTVRPKARWRDAVTSLPVPFETVHLDERSPEVRAATVDATPAVVAHVDDGVVVLLGPAELDACRGDVEELLARLWSAMEDHQLVFDDAGGRG